MGEVGDVQGRGGGAVVARGLLQHEAKLTVLNFGVKKAAGYEEALPSKTELLLVTGLRCGSLGIPLVHGLLRKAFATLQSIGTLSTSSY